MDRTDLAARMKENYEKPYSLEFPRRLPLVIRLDGKAFHTLTRGMEKPFDDGFIECMMATTLELAKQVQTTVFAYSQSDEISLLLHNFKKFTTQPWLGNEVQKITSISAGIASSVFSMRHGKQAVFDSRAFVLPVEEVANYFVWRQQDATRNSIQATAQSMYSHKELDNKPIKEQQEMIFQKGFNWNDTPTHKKRGFCVKKVEVVVEQMGQAVIIDQWVVDQEIPTFSQAREYVEGWLGVDDG